MATAIIDLSKKQGGCLPQDLNAQGFSPDEVAQHWCMAKALADVEMKLMSRPPSKLKSIFGRHE